MARAFPGAEIKAPKDREYDYGLDDPDDGHVAHAAILGKADAIVTDDKRAGFTTSTAWREAAIDIVHPHHFAANMVSTHPEAGVRALLAMSGRMATPSLSPWDVLEDLRVRYGMDEVALTLAPLLPPTAPPARDPRTPSS